MLLKKSLNWIVVAVSSLIGVLGLAHLGTQEVSLATTDRWWFSFIAASALFAVVPLLATTLALLNGRRRAALTLLLAVPIFARWAVLNAGYIADLSHIYSAFAGVCFVLGFYWLFAWWRDWPALLSRPLSVGHKVVAVFLIGTLDLTATFGLESLPYPPVGDCGLRGVFSRSTFGRDAVFTAHLIRVGHQVKVSDAWVGSWAVARVQERFWGWHFPGIVFLSANGLREGDDYLVEGRRPVGLLTRFLPIVEIRNCNRSARLADAVVELRLLRSGFPTSDVRIMGRVIRWNAGGEPQMPYAALRYAPVPGARVAIIGPGPAIVATTDQAGIYDVQGLPPGRYKAQLQDDASRRPSMAFFDYGADLKAGEVAEYSFSVE